MSDKFICKDGASLYYLKNEGMGGFLNPPGDAEHSYSIVEKRGGHECAFISLRGALSESWIPEAVKASARGVLKRHVPTFTEEWISEVYRHFQHCYSPDGVDSNVSNCKIYGKFWGNAEREKDENPEHHLAYLFVRQFDTNHKPRTDLF